MHKKRLKPTSKENMMPPNITIKWTPFALGCLDEIYDYISFRENNHSPALKLINEIFNRTNQLINFPESGQTEMLLSENNQYGRYLIIKSYKIIYEYHANNQSIIITDIFHTSQDPINVSERNK